MVIDINLDDGLLDGMAAMQKFCKIAVTEPDVSKVMTNRHGAYPGRLHVVAVVDEQEAFGLIFAVSHGRRRITGSWT